MHTMYTGVGHGIRIMYGVIRGYVWLFLIIFIFSASGDRIAYLQEYKYRCIYAFIYINSAGAHYMRDYVMHIDCILYWFVSNT